MDATCQLYDHTIRTFTKETVCFDVQRNFKNPFVDDGLIEVIYFKDAWHGNDFLPSKDQGECLVQVSQNACTFALNLELVNFLRYLNSRILTKETYKNEVLIYIYLDTRIGTLNKQLGKKTCENLLWNP